MVRVGLFTSGRYVDFDGTGMGFRGMGCGGCLEGSVASLDPDNRPGGEGLRSEYGFFFVDLSIERFEQPDR